MKLEFGHIERACRAADQLCHQPISAIVLAAMLLISYSAEGSAPGDPVRGETIYRDCMACHSLDKNGMAPKHRGVFGSKAGMVADYEYSAALKNSNIVSNDDALDRWLSNPQSLVPGTKMLYWVDNAQDRADVIAFLREQSNQ
jgi:cytochrome c